MLCTAILFPVTYLPEILCRPDTSVHAECEKVSSIDAGFFGSPFVLTRDYEIKNGLTQKKIICNRGTLVDIHYEVQFILNFNHVAKGSMNIAFVGFETQLTNAKLLVELNSCSSNLFLNIKI